MKIVKTDWRSRLTEDSLSDLMLIKLDSPDVQEFDPQPAIDVWMQKKRMPDFYDRGPRREAGREVEGDPDLVGPQKAHDVILALPLALDKQAATPGPSTEGSQHLSDVAVEDDNVSDYYTDDENESDDILREQEEEAYNLLTSL